MKFFGVIVLLAVAASCQAEANERSKRSTINENLVSMVEGLRDSMKTGNEDLGLPILEPYQADSLELAIDESLATLDATLKNLIVNGLSEFEINTLTFTLIGVRFNFDFTWSNINATSKYDIDGIVGSLIPIYGSGEFNMAVKNMRFSGSLQLSVKDLYLYVRSLETAVNMGGFEFTATGILNDDGVSSLVSAVVSDLVPQMVDDYQTLITSKINTVITELADGMLGTMTLAELLALIRG